MLAGTEYLHENGIVQDLKCDSYALAWMSYEAPLKLLDLGLSTAILPGQHLKEMVGIMQYMAPELVTHWYDQKCDLWSIGRMLYFCKAYQTPWGSKTEHEIWCFLDDDSLMIKYDESWTRKPWMWRFV